jgi:hypothetical protein
MLSGIDDEERRPATLRNLKRDRAVGKEVFAMRNQIGVAWIIAAVTVSCSLTAAHAQSHCGYFGLGPVPAGISSLAVALNNGDQVVIGPSSTFSSDQFPGYVWEEVVPEIWTAG